MGRLRGHGSVRLPVTLFIVIHTTLAELGTHTYTSRRSNLDFIQFKGILELLWRFINQFALNVSLSASLLLIFTCVTNRDARSDIHEYLPM